MFMNYWILLLMDLLEDAITTNYVGFAMIATISLNLLINFSYILFTAIKAMFIKYRLKYYQWKLKRLMKKADEN